MYIYMRTVNAFVELKKAARIILMKFVCTQFNYTTNWKYDIPCLKPEMIQCQIRNKAIFILKNVVRIFAKVTENSPLNLLVQYNL